MRIDKLLIICDPLGKNSHSLHNFNFFFISQHYLQCLRSGYLKFHLNQASSFEVTALDRRASTKINFIQKINYRRLHSLPVF